MRLTGARYYSGLLAVIVAASLFPANKLGREGVSREWKYRQTREINADAIFNPPPAKENSSWHPPHVVKTWRTTYKGRVFRVTQMPRCEHVETLITYNPSGETLGRAKLRTGGFAACTGSFHNSRSMALADFFQKNGSLISSSRTGRSFVAVNEDGKVHISSDYAEYKRKPGVSALALGQRLVPLEKDGFSSGFMNRQTDRMAIGTNDNFIFIIRGKTDIWRLASFLKHRLPVNSAINSDGGHVVRGRAPVHIVFRWRKSPPDFDWTVKIRNKQDKNGG